MAKLAWDATGERFYETGVSKGVLYVYDSSKSTKNYGPGVAWNGLSSITESPSGAEANDIYADNTKYLTLLSAEKLDATVEAYTYPTAFGACDGSAEISDGITIGQQARKTFGLSYRTVLGNDSDGDTYGYKLHLIYGCKASPSEKAFQTINDSPEAISFSWSISTTPVSVTGNNPTASVVIDSRKVGAAAMAKIEEALYGTETEDAYLPTPDELLTLIAAAG